MPYCSQCRSLVAWTDSYCPQCGTAQSGQQLSPSIPDGFGARSVLLLFVPGLYLCLILSAALSVAFASFLIALLYWIFSLIGRIPVGMIVLLAVGGLYGVWISLYAGWRSITRVEVFCHGRALQPSQAPRLWKMLSDLATQMRTAVPDRVVLELSNEFYVTEGIVVTFDEKLKGRTLCVSAPLLHALSVDEVRAIVAHELAHFTGNDTAFTRWFYPVYTGTTAAIRKISQATSGESQSRSVMSLPLLAPLFVFSTYLSIFSRLERSISRQREMRADQISAKHVGAVAISSALQRVYAYAALWPQVHEGMISLLRKGKSFVNASEFFINYARDSDHLQMAAAKIDAVVPAHPTDTHPPLQARLAALGQTTGPVSSFAESHSSTELVDKLDEIERSLTDSETSFLAALLGRLGIAIPSVFCNNCGEPIGSTDVSCTSCGKPLVGRHANTARA